MIFFNSDDIYDRFQHGNYFQRALNIFYDTDRMFNGNRGIDVFLNSTATQIINKSGYYIKDSPHITATITMTTTETITTMMMIFFLADI